MFHDSRRKVAKILYVDHFSLKKLHGTNNVSMYIILIKSANTKTSARRAWLPAKYWELVVMFRSVLSVLMLFYVFSEILGTKGTACTQRTVDNHCCRFPFYYKGIRYRSCTYHDDVDNRFWCPTEDFKYSRNVTTSWGYCKSKLL